MIKRFSLGLLSLALTTSMISVASAAGKIKPYATKYVKVTETYYLRACPQTYNYADKYGYQGTLELIAFVYKEPYISCTCTYGGYVSQN